jgi:hypothetical protein
MVPAADLALRQGLRRTLDFSGREPGERRKSFRYFGRTPTHIAAHIRAGEQLIEMASVGPRGDERRDGPVGATCTRHEKNNPGLSGN